MEVKWLVEDYERDGSLQPLMDEIKKQGMHLEVVKYEPFESGEYNQYEVDDCVVFYGSLNLGKQLQKQKGWIPGVYCNFQNLCCIVYYSHWGKYLLNRDYIILPLMEIKRRKDYIYKTLGIDDCIFIRPDSGSKTFTGQILIKEEADKELGILEGYAGKPSDQIIAIISTPKIIYAEWRFVIVNKKVVAQSQYRRTVEDNIVGQSIEIGLNIKEGCSVGARILAEKIANEEWQPDKAYTLDICQDPEGYWLLEANSFSCSGLYACNPEDVVREISKIALDEWKEYEI